MHYTSVENIHKVIDPLFLNDLKDELNEIKKTKQPAALKRKAKAFQEKLSNLTFFDPACGSGNFLTETYLQLRRLENNAIKLIYPNPSLDVGQAKDIIKVSIQQFYGIEINDFAVSVAKTALWIAESQMLEETKDIFYADWDFLPLKTYTHIHEGNALTMDWNKVIPNYACHYVMGNPPFIGYGMQTREQKEDIKKIYVDKNGKELNRAGKIDFVAGWYYKASQYIYKTNTKVAFVSTNSITQGDQVYPVWHPLFMLFKIHINFAYKTFVWNSEAKDKAHVHVVIIGFSWCKSHKDKRLYLNNTFEKVESINPYLVNGSDNVLINSRTDPLCNIPKMITGNRPADGGNLIIEAEDLKKFISKEPESKKWIRRLTGSREYLHNKKRYCLWLKNITPAEIKRLPLILDRVEKVRQFRLNSKKKATQRSAETSWLFQEDRQPKSNYLIVPSTTSQVRRYIPIGFMDPKVIVTDAVHFIPDAGLYEFGILESNVHMAWMRTIAGRLKSDYRYSVKIVYNNFPWPSPTEDQKEKIKKTAQSILDARALYPDSSLADLYDPLTMPKELLKAHQDNDRAVMEAYDLPVRGTTESDAVAHLFKMYENLEKSKEKE